MGSQQVRRAVRAEVPVLAGTLQAAFDGYPWIDWAFPADERAARIRACFALYLAASIDGQGEVWTTDNHACVAMWQGPVTNTFTDPTPTESRQLRARTATLLGENAERVEAVLDTSTRSNVELYAGMGFQTTAELHPAPGAPTVWVMTRSPRSPA